MKATNLRLTESDRDHLVAGAAALGIELDADMVANFGHFADVLDLWTRRVNLVSCGSARELVERHFLDSLAIAPLLPETGAIVDLGSGAGFPGLPLAIFKRQRGVVLVEVRRRRASFLREVRRTLGLDNVEILEQRAEVIPPRYKHQAGSVVSRAVWSEESVLEIALAWLKPEGRLFWMRSEPWSISPGFNGLIQDRAVHYRIGSGGLRTVEVFQSLPVHCST